MFYAWKPDCKKIFGLRVALQDTKEAVHEKLEKPGRPQTIRRQELRRKSCVIAGETDGLLHRKAISY